MKISEHIALTRIRTKGFLGACMVGAGAGALSAFVSDLSATQSIPLGVLVVFIGGNVGGALGTLVRGAALRFMYGKWESSFNSEGVLVLSAYGAFIGLVAALAVGAGPWMNLWVGIGAALGGVLASVSGGTLQVLMHLLVLDEMDEQSRTSALRRGARATREAMLDPEERGESKSD